MSLLGTFFRRVGFGRALNKLASLYNLTRVFNVLEDIQGVNCCIEKPVDAEGRGWRIVVGPSDEPPPGGGEPPWESAAQCDADANPSTSMSTTRNDNPVPSAGEQKERSIRLYGFLLGYTTWPADESPSAPGDVSILYRDANASGTGVPDLRYAPFFMVAGKGDADAETPTSLSVATEANSTGTVREFVLHGFRTVLNNGNWLTGETLLSRYSASGGAPTLRYHTATQLFAVQAFENRVLEIIGDLLSDPDSPIVGLISDMIGAAPHQPMQPLNTGDYYVAHEGSDGAGWATLATALANLSQGQGNVIADLEARVAALEGNGNT